MSETIRLNKVLKELNISIDRAVDYLAEKGVELERRPTTKISNATYDILIQEFKSDAQQKAASEEVVLAKIPEPTKKPSQTETPTPQQPINKTAEQQSEEAKKEAPKQEEPPVQNKEEANKEQPKEQPKTEEKPKTEHELPGIKTLGKIDLPSTKKPKNQKSQEKTEPNQPTTETTKQSATPTPAEDKQAQQSKTEEKTPQAKSDQVKSDPTKSEKTQPDEAEGTGVIETQYKKLQGPNLTGQTIDVSAFKKKEKPKSQEEKKKRKRIHKTQKPGTNQGGSGDNRSRKPGQTGNRPPSRRNTPAPELTEEQVQKQIKETLEKLTNKGKNKFGARHRRDKRKERQAQEAIEQEAIDQDKTLNVTEFVTVSELSKLMEVSVAEIISACMTLGIMVTMNQRLEAETIQLVAEEFGYEANFTDSEIEEVIEEEQDAPEDLQPRAPIVTVMGHVDHGKTSLLDYIREANVIAGESGGITQHIGAYSVQLDNGQRITFLDTPGHEAFTAMRARGAQLTDMAIIVIAADDQIMPQTKEAISHAQAAEVPLVFAINKIDKPDANPEKVKEQLASMDLLVEDWGGSIQSEDISAKKGIHIKELLEKVLLEAEILELKANPNRLATGTVVEASLDKGRGYVSTILVQNGTLRVGDYILAGSNHGKVKAMLDERGKPVKEAKPSTPVSVLGLDGAPTAGDKFRVFEDEREAKQIALKREQLQREQSQRAKDKTRLSLVDLGKRLELGDFQTLNIILKGDVDGSVEALTDSLQKLSTEQIEVNILHKGVGPITESDVLLASASEAIVIGFNVRPGVSAREIADKEGVEIRTYSIIYDAINELKDAMEGMLSPEMKEEVIGSVEIRETFKISKVGTIAGCMVLNGKITRNSKIRIIREGTVIHDGELASLKRFKDDVKEVNKGYECGLNIKNYNNIEVGDQLEVYQTIEVRKKL